MVVTDNLPSDLILTDIDSGVETTAPSDGFTQLKPNGGVRPIHLLCPAPKRTGPGNGKKSRKGFPIHGAYRF